MRGRWLLLAAAAAVLVAVPGWLAHGLSRTRARGAVYPPGFAAPLALDGPTGTMAFADRWTVSSDPADRGASRGWARGHFRGARELLPFDANARHVIGAAGITSFQGSVEWYRTSFQVPTNGDYAVHFESVNHKATVWLDGRQMGGVHVGTYMPFERIATLRAGHRYTLVVRADYRDPLAMRETGWGRTWFNYGGINREVSLRRLGPSDLSAPTVQTRLQPGGGAIVDLSVHVLNRGAGRMIGVHASLSGQDGTHQADFPRTRIPAGQTRVLHTQVTVPHPALWAPAHPNLYNLDLETTNQESGFRLRTGLRQVTWHGQQWFLNNRPFTIHGASLQEDVPTHGDALTGVDMDRIVRELKAVGADATRTQHPLNPALLDRLDAAGILVWQGIGPVDAPGNWTSKTRALQAEAGRRVLTTVNEDQTHPSILTWNLANEVAGNGHPGGEAAYIDGSARELHRRDPGRPVAVDVWGVHPPKVAGPMYRNIDAIGDTNYIGWYSDTNAPRAAVARAIRAHLANFRKVFANKILVVSEFGAEANARNPANTPGGFAFQSALLRLHTSIYATYPTLRGMLVWDLRDFGVAPSFAGGSIRRTVPGIQLVRGLNQKGLFDYYDGRRKPGAVAVAAAFAHLPVP